MTDLFMPACPACGYKDEDGFAKVDRALIRPEGPIYVLNCGCKITYNNVGQPVSMETSKEMKAMWQYNPVGEDTKVAPGTTAEG